ncbi:MULTISPECIES: hypothetical protein [unclassified Nocardia]|uniref:hypothetical protein n=1 Tax=unclassified Nocardia TaxID=2637762 RepID=UPI001CE3EC01|nr:MULTISPECIES: hypothetical protein [unclassified Nocardia]
MNYVIRIALLLCAFGLFAGSGGMARAVPATASGGIGIVATIDDREISGATSDAPVRLNPDSAVRLTVMVANGTGSPIVVHRVDLAGHVLGLTFFSYSTAVELTIPAGKSDTLRYSLDLTGLRGQATGLIGAKLTVVGTDGATIATVPTVTDVRGSVWSVYGLFGVALSVLTALAIADAALSIARHRLGANRWQRGLRLLAPGIGIGLVFGFTASVLRWWVPQTELWLAVGGGCAAMAFLLGYCSPTPEPDYEVPEFAELEGDLDDDLVGPPDPVAPNPPIPFAARFPSDEPDTVRFATADPGSGQGPQHLSGAPETVRFPVPGSAKGVREEGVGR